MKAVALKPILYNGRIYDKGEEFEIDEVSFYVRLKRGDIKTESGEAVEEELVNVTEGLPELDELPVKKK